MADWGDTTAGYTIAWNLGNLFAWLGGISPAGSNVLTGIYLRTTEAATYRLAVYSGGAADDPDGASLLEDLGTFAHTGGGGFEGITTLVGTSLPDAGLMWMRIANSAFNGPRRAGSANVPAGDVDYVVTQAGDNSNGAAPATAPSATYTATSRSTGVYITYGAAAATSGASERSRPRGRKRGHARGRVHRIAADGFERINGLFVPAGLWVPGGGTLQGV